MLPANESVGLMFIGSVTLGELTSVFVFLRDDLWFGEMMSYYINIQLFAFSAELKEMFLSLVTSMGVPESSKHKYTDSALC